MLIIKIITCAYKIITCAYKILLMIKIITCAYKIITCAYNYMHFIKDEKRNLLFSMQKYIKNNNPKILRNRQNRLMIQSNYATCGGKKSRFIKEQQAMGI